VPAAFDIALLPSLDQGSAMPLWMQLAERLAAPIRERQAALAGRALPTEARCMAQFGVSRPTVRQAMAHLVASGLVSRGRGKGTFVAPGRLNHDVSMAFEDEMRAARRSIRFQLLSRMLHPAPEPVRSSLGLPQGAEVECIERLLFLDDEVFAFEQRYIAPELGRRITTRMLERMAIISLLTEALGQPPARIVNTVRCLPAGARIARLLGVGARTPLLETEHAHYAASGAAVLHGSVRFHGERFQFSLDSPIRVTRSPWPISVRRPWPMRSPMAG
jgi:GntR family transcriptional regulator